MKLDPHLPALPTIAELLEHPRVKSVVARINRSTLAHRASGFLDELRATLAERAGRFEAPSVAQLAERLARQLVGEAARGCPIVNATGIVVGDPDLAPPLADAAVHATIQVVSDYHGRGDDVVRRIERELCSQSGAEAALMVSGFDAALAAVLSLATAREMLVAQPSGAEGPVDWPRWAARAGAVLRIAAGDEPSLTSALASGERPAVLVRSPTAEAGMSTRDLAALARQCSAAFLDVAPLAGVFNPQAYGKQSVETLGERIAAGADVVLADGAGLIGGPSCGIVAGKRSLVEQAAAHPIAGMARLDAASAAALHATLTAYSEDRDGSAALAIPVWQLLSAPLANLQQRGERLAALIAASPGVAAAEARTVSTPWLRSGRESLSAETTIIAVQPKGAEATAVADRLRHGPHGIAAATVDGEIWLDLRSVFPRWDQQLVAALAGADG